MAGVAGQYCCRILVIGIPGKCQHRISNFTALGLRSQLEVFLRDIVITHRKLIRLDFLECVGEPVYRIVSTRSRTVATGVAHNQFEIDIGFLSRLQLVGDR